MTEEKATDIGFTRGNSWFRYRACAIIIEDSAVLMAHNNQDDYFYSIGGAVKLGETAEEACLREVFEETGVPYEVERLVFIHENFFTLEEAESSPKRAHELAFYFLMKPHEYGIFKTETRGDWKERVKWLPIESYANYKAFPQFFAEKLQKLPETVERVVTYE